MFSYWDSAHDEGLCRSLGGDYSIFAVGDGFRHFFACSSVTIVNRDRFLVPAPVTVVTPACCLSNAIVASSLGNSREHDPNRESGS